LLLFERAPACFFVGFVFSVNFRRFFCFSLFATLSFVPPARSFTLASPPLPTDRFTKPLGPFFSFRVPPPPFAFFLAFRTRPPLAAPSRSSLPTLFVGAILVDRWRGPIFANCSRTLLGFTVGITFFLLFYFVFRLSSWFPRLAASRTQAFYPATPSTPKPTVGSEANPVLTAHSF